ncbi:unnamed protein product [Ilex paraguariensis]|uniref:Uncharacterized protein n=1 Tax=Ilex paraguariensis TaxID=185542 RepID=A0ABC8U294_9AQUA
MLSSWGKKETEMARRNVFDVCPFLLFEVTGDSEVDSDLNMVGTIIEEDRVEVAEDDAESCSCELDDDVRLNEFDDSDHNREHDHGNDHLHENDKEAAEKEEGEVINQDWTGDKGVLSSTNSISKFVMARKRKKSEVCVDKTLEVMNQRDRDRLFWETCLAS